MVHAESVRRLLGVLLDCIADLERYKANVGREQLESERDVQHMVLHALYVATQSAIDLAMHVAADAGMPQATTYQQAFQHLADAGWLDRVLASRLAGWAGFRNVLAYSYAVVDYARVFDALNEVDDLEAFARVVAAKLDPLP